MRVAGHILWNKSCLTLLVFAMLAGCATEDLLLKSKFYEDRIGNKVSLQTGTFNEARDFSSSFNLDEIKGGVSLNNVLLYQEDKGAFVRAIPGVFRIYVDMQQVNTQKIDLLLTDVSGVITLKDSRKIKPNLILYGKSYLCEKEYLKNWEPTKPVVPVSWTRDSTCLWFEYPEFVSSEIEFEMEVATINHAKKINLSFMPMITRAKGH